VGVEDKTYMLQDYNQFGEIPPFRVNTDTSLKLNDEDVHGYATIVSKGH
jgi:hypothetical protein